jgi:hypothetical protein
MALNMISGAEMFPHPHNYKKRLYLEEIGDTQSDEFSVTTPAVTN